MEAHHKQAINELWQTLIERLVPSVDSYISYLGMHRVISMADQQRIRNTCVTNEEKLPNVLHLIQGKDKSWESTITYLRGNNFETLAKQLEIAASTALSSTGGQKGCPKDAIEAHLDEILNTLEYDVEPLFNHLESKKAIRFDLKPVIDKQVTEKAKLDILLKKLITTDNGWEAFVSYLKSHHHVRLANKLENSSGMTS